jgi:hypothetical protein
MHALDMAMHAPRPSMSADLAVHVELLVLWQLPNSVPE